MALIGAGEIHRLRHIYADSLGCKCKIWSYASTQDSTGLLVATAPVWANISEIACGIDPWGSSESARRDMTLGVYDALLRVPLGTTIATKDRVQWTESWGADLTTPIVFEVAGPPRQGPLGILAPLKRIA
jgi:hypothetical protein